MLMSNIKWLGHASFLITSDETDSTVYIDPYNIKSDAIANFILITHTHYDHFSEKDLMMIANQYTVIFAPTDAVPKLKEMHFPGEIVTVTPNNTYQRENLILETVPAYNLFKGFHPQSNGWVGYIIELDRKRIYHSGDTDALEELKKITNIDVVMLPVGGTYTMGPKEAAELANAIHPKIAIPMHYGTVVGTVSDAEEFKRLFNGQTRIMTV